MGATGELKVGGKSSCSHVFCLPRHLSQPLWGGQTGRAQHSLAWHGAVMSLQLSEQLCGWGPQPMVGKGDHL